MAGLRDLRNRIRSIKNTKQITSAMKMVAAAKLRRAQERTEASRAYAQGLHRILSTSLTHVTGLDTLPVLLTGRPDTNRELILILTSDRGLCGSFNASIIRYTRTYLTQLQATGRPFSLLCIGKKAYDALKREYGNHVLEFHDLNRKDIDKAGCPLSYAERLGERLSHYIESAEYGRISAIYTFFHSVLSQEVKRLSLVPFFDVSEDDQAHKALYEFEPSQSQLIPQLLEKNFAVQLHQLLLESFASEHGARMTAMDHATRNANDVIKKLELVYNRTRQANITRELIEIISGAEAL